MAKVLVNGVEVDDEEIQNFDIVEDLMDYLEVLVEHNDFEKIELINEGLKDINGDIRGMYKTRFIHQANEFLFDYFENPKIVISKIEEFSKHGMDERITKSLEKEILNMFTPESYYEYQDVEDLDKNTDLNIETEDPKVMLNQFNNNHENTMKSLIAFQVDKIISLNDLEINEVFNQDDLDNIVTTVNSKMSLLPDKVVNKIIFELDKQIIENNINKEQFIIKLEDFGATSLITQSLKGVDLSKMYELSKMSLSVSPTYDKENIDNAEAILLDPEYNQLIVVYNGNNAENGKEFYMADKYNVDYENKTLTRVGSSQMQDMNLSEALKHIKKLNQKAIEVSTPIVIENKVEKTKNKKISQNLELDL